MINIWDYVGAGRIRLVDTDGDEFEGAVVCVMDTEENGRDEDDITICVNGKYIGFKQSEIRSIEPLNKGQDHTVRK